jgi:hypothetical protein
MFKGVANIQLGTKKGNNNTTESVKVSFVIVYLVEREKLRGLSKATTDKL